MTAAPRVISSSMNMIVAEFAGVGWSAYAAVMAPISVVGAPLTFAILRSHYRDVLAAAVSNPRPATLPPAQRAERSAFALLLVVILSHPVMAALGGSIWLVGVALGYFLLVRLPRVISGSKLLGHVSFDILAFQN